MFKKFKKVVALILICSLTLLQGQHSVLAAPKTSYVIKGINSSNSVMVTKEGTRSIAKVTVGDYTYISTKLMNSDAVILQVYDSKNLIKTVTVSNSNINKANISISDNKSNNLVTFAAAKSVKQNTFFNYEYTKKFGSPNKWELRRPNGSLTGTYYFKADETSSNSDYLDAFRNNVEDLNTLEGKIIAAAGSEVFLLALAGAIALGTGGIGGALAAYLASVGSAGAAVALCLDGDRVMADAENNYYNVYFNSNVYF